MSKKKTDKYKRYQANLQFLRKEDQERLLSLVEESRAIMTDQIRRNHNMIVQFSKPSIVLNAMEHFVFHLKQQQQKQEERR